MGTKKLMQVWPETIHWVAHFPFTGRASEPCGLPEKGSGVRQEIARKLYRCFGAL
jgi:hypothetical protein